VLTQNPDRVFQQLHTHWLPGEMYPDRSHTRRNVNSNGSNYEKQAVVYQTGRNTSRGATTTKEESSDTTDSIHESGEYYEGPVVLVANPYSPDHESRKLINSVSAAMVTSQGQAGSSKEVLKLSMDISRIRKEFAELLKTVHDLGKGLQTSKQASETQEVVYNSTLAQVVSNVDDLVLKNQNTAADIVNLTNGLTKVAKVHNKNNSVTNSKLAELDIGQQALLQQHNALQKWIYREIDEVHESQQSLQRESEDRKEQLDMSISLTLGKIDDFVTLNQNFEDSYQKCQDMYETTDLLKRMVTDHNGMKKRLDELDQLKDLSQRLIKRMNQLGFDENESLNISRRIDWNADVRQLRQRLTLLSYSCLPLPASFTNLLSTRPSSPQCSLLLPGIGEYYLRIEIGEHVSFPQYLGIYIHVDGDVFPITLEGTSLKFLGKKFDYSAMDLCTKPTCSCFRVLISYSDAQRMMVNDHLSIQCDFKIALANARENQDELEYSPSAANTDDRHR